MMALEQEDYMRSVVGDDPELWKKLPSYFTPGTPFSTTAGGEILEGPRKYDAAKKLLADAGYNGEKIVLLVATDIAITKAEGDVSADLMGNKLGMNVDYQALDWGTVGARRAKKESPAEGGWNVFHTWHAGADCINPAPYTALDAGGASAWFGWPNSPKIEADINTCTTPLTRLPKGGHGHHQPRFDGIRDLRADRVLPAISVLAEEHLGRRQGAVPGVLGCDQDLMLSYIGRRIVSTIPVMAIVALFVFSLLYLAPGDPAAIIAGDQASPADVERIRAGLGLDRPFLVRFLEWLWNVLRGDLGTSIFTNLPVTTMIQQRLEPTISLMILTLILSIGLAVPMGVLAAWKHGTWIDRIIMMIAVFGFSVPVFVVGYLMAYVFALDGLGIAAMVGDLFGQGAADRRPRA